HLILLWPYLHPNRDLFWLHEVIPNRLHYQVGFRMLSRRLQYFFTVSYTVAESLRRIGIPDHKIRMVHNGLSDPTTGVEQNKKSNSIVRLGIAGQIGAWKGHEDLLKAFKQ